MGSPVTSDDLPPLTDTASICARFSELIRVRDLFSEFLGWLLGGDGELSDAAVEGIADRTTPIGTVLMYASGSPPPGGKYMMCNGQAVSRTTYPDLFSRIGTYFGAGDTTTTFNLPNFQNRFPIGQGADYALGGTGGAKTITLAAGNVPNHYHGFGKSLSGENDADFLVRNWTAPSTGYTAGFRVLGDGVGVQGNPVAVFTSGDLATSLPIEDATASPTPTASLPPYLGVSFMIKVL